MGVFFYQQCPRLNICIAPTLKLLCPLKERLYSIRNHISHIVPCPSTKRKKWIHWFCKQFTSLDNINTQYHQHYNHNITAVPSSLVKECIVTSKTSTCTVYHKGAYLTRIATLWLYAHMRQVKSQFMQMSFFLCFDASIRCFGQREEKQCLFISKVKKGCDFAFFSSVSLNDKTERPWREQRKTL